MGTPTSEVLPPPPGIDCIKEFQSEFENILYIFVSCLNLPVLVTFGQSDEAYSDGF